MGYIYQSVEINAEPEICIDTDEIVEQVRQELDLDDLATQVSSELDVEGVVRSELENIDMLEQLGQCITDSANYRRDLYKAQQSLSERASSAENRAKEATLELTRFAMMLAKVVSHESSVIQDDVHEEAQVLLRQRELEIQRKLEKEQEGAQANEGATQ